MRLKTLDMSSDIDKKILLTYFFKKLDTTINKDELLKLSCIWYDSEQNYLYPVTKRFQNILSPYKDKKVLNKNVDDTLQKVLSEEFRLQEELVRCDLQLNNTTNHFYIAVIGVDYFMTESKIRTEINNSENILSS